MTLEFFDEYWDWRIAYWQTGAGAAIRQNFPQKRNSSLIPADKSLKMEKSALRQIFNDAHARRRMTFLPTINAPRKRGRDPRRAGFDSEEWNALAVNLRNYANAVGAVPRQQQLLPFYDAETALPLFCPQIFTGLP